MTICDDPPYTFYPDVGLIFREIVESAASRFSNLIVRPTDGEFEEKFSRLSIRNDRLGSEDRPSLNCSNHQLPSAVDFKLCTQRFKIDSE